MKRLDGWSLAVTIVGCAVLAFLLLPNLIVIPIAFGNRNAIVFPPVDFGLAMFHALISEPGWLVATWLSFRIACFTAAISVLLAVPAAYGIARGRFAGKRLLTLILLSPMMVPAVVVALGLYLYYANIGLTFGFARLVIAHVLVTLPFVLITSLGGLQQIDPTIETAAKVMGAGRITVLRRVTLPLIAPSITAGVLFAFLISFDEVVLSWFVAQPDSTTLPVRMFASIQYDVSSVLAAISFILTVISTAFCIGVASLQRQETQ
jgi:putative spermidine/putrescine transport system permease protein